MNPRVSCRPFSLKVLSFPLSDGGNSKLGHARPVSPVPSSSSPRAQLVNGTNCRVIPSGKMYGNHIFPFSFPPHGFMGGRAVHVPQRSRPGFISAVTIPISESIGPSVVQIAFSPCVVPLISSSVICALPKAEMPL
jgi:hypothetical protein